jgi:hypothetical protein
MFQNQHSEGRSKFLICEENRLKKLANILEQNFNVSDILSTNNLKLIFNGTAELHDGYLSSCTDINFTGPRIKAKNYQ